MHVEALKDSLPKPPHEIRGETPVDQAWIDEMVVAGQACCGWGDIKPRPAELDKTHTVAGKIVPLPAPPKKKRFRDRVRALIHT